MLVDEINRAVAAASGTLLVGVLNARGDCHRLGLNQREVGQVAALAIFADFREVDDALPGPEVLRRLARVKGLPLTVVARGLVLGTISVPRSTR